MLRASMQPSGMVVSMSFRLPESGTGGMVSAGLARRRKLVEEDRKDGEQACKRTAASAPTRSSPPYRPHAR